jgi:hypothetical protein
MCCCTLRALSLLPALRAGAVIAATAVGAGLRLHTADCSFGKDKDLVGIHVLHLYLNLSQSPD